MRLIDIFAPEIEIINLPYCEYNDNGQPSRRTKLRYLLRNKVRQSELLEEFIEADVNNILQLIYSLNSGTHGSLGILNIQQLLKLKKRAEDSLLFICKLNSLD